MGVISNIWWMLVLIGVMILIHELGHYWAARWFDVKVEAFSFGFGPRLFGFRRGETDFRVSLIPFGGYVKMTGEQAGEDGGEDPRGFLAKPRWQRMIIAFAGPLMNILLAVGLLAGLYMNRYPKVVGADGPPVVGFIEKDSPAAKAGVQELDTIVAIDGKQNPTWEEIMLTVVGAANREVPLVLTRNGQQVLSQIVPEIDEQTGVGGAGWYDRHEIQVGALSAGMGAEKAGIKSGDRVKVSSARGQLFGPALVTKRLRTLKVKGENVYHVGLPIHWGFTGKVSGPLINNLTPSAYDPNSGTPEYKGFLVNLEKA